MAAPSASAASIITVGDDDTWPGSPDLEVANPDTPGLNGDDTSGDPDGSLAQTFQVQGSSLTVRSIFLRYRNDSASTGDLEVDMTIFTVDDVLASTIADPPPGTGATLFSETVSFPEALGSSTNRVAHIVLDTPLNLPANTGDEGYAVFFSGNGSFEWFRTGSTAGSVYAFGAFYEDGDWKNGGERDATLTLSSVIPEPTTLLLASVCSVSIPFMRRTRG